MSGRSWTREECAGTDPSLIPSKSLLVPCLAGKVGKQGLELTGHIGRLTRGIGPCLIYVA